jgi:hypothetical protein
MKTLRPHPGKFEGNESQMLAEIVYNASMEGCCEELGEVDGFGFYAFVKGKRYGFIMSEDSQGFVSVYYYTLSEARQKWAAIEKEYEEWTTESEELNED